jgi:hypothetical protein
MRPGNHLGPEKGGEGSQKLLNDCRSREGSNPLICHDC